MSNKKSNIKYTFSQKVEALMIFKRNGFDSKKTSEQLKINSATLNRWRSEYGDEVYSHMDSLVHMGREQEVDRIRKNVIDDHIEFEVIRAAKKLMATELDFANVIRHLKFKVADKINTLIDKSTSLPAVTEALRAIHQIEYSGKETDDEMRKGQRTFMDMVKDHYSGKRGEIKFKRTDIEDAEEVEHSSEEDTNGYPHIN